MGKIDIFDAHEKDSAWTKLWLLTDRDAAGVHSHYTGLTFPEGRSWWRSSRTSWRTTGRWWLGIA